MPPAQTVILDGSAWAFPRLLLGALLGAASAVVLLASFRPAYDRGHPDYERYAPVFASLRQQFLSGGKVDDTLDLSPLNGGDWKMACVFGGYTDPLEHMAALGASVADMDRLRLGLAGVRGVRLGQVEEFKILIAFIDRQNRAHFIHFEEGIGSEGQHLEQCTARPDTRINLGGPSARSGLAGPSWGLAMGRQRFYEGSRERRMPRLSQEGLT